MKEGVRDVDSKLQNYSDLIMPQRTSSLDCVSITTKKTRNIQIYLFDLFIYVIRNNTPFAQPKGFTEYLEDSGKLREERKERMTQKTSGIMGPLRSYASTYVFNLLVIGSSVGGHKPESRRLKLEVGE